MPGALLSSVTFKSGWLLGKQETNTFIWFSLIRLEIFLVVVLIQSVSSQISSTLICNSLAGSAASSAEAAMLLPPGGPLLHHRGSPWLPRPGVPRGSHAARRSIFQRLWIPSGERRAVRAALTAVPEQFSARVWALAENLACEASDRAHGSAGSSSEEAAHCLLCNFHSLLSALRPPHFFQRLPQHSHPCLRDIVPLPCLQRRA